MNRLTYKLDEPIKTKYLNYEYKRIPDYDINRGNYGRISDDMIFNKLGKLEDIEKDLDIELTTLFEIYNKMCEQEFVYIKIGDKIKCFYYDYYLIDFKNKEIVCMNYEPEEWLLFIDYGITWALSREGLK